MQFFQTRYKEGNIQARLDNNNIPYLTLRLVIKDQQTRFEKIQFNLVSMFSNVGGLASYVVGVIAFIINPIQEFFFYQSLIKKTYLTEKLDNNDKTENQEKYDLKNLNPTNFLSMVIDLKNRSKFFYQKQEACKDCFWNCLTLG
ncbi:UNKNOWN [Stylonychia lemnae]|uniref:Transmembrane protein n=1 Tax=Stylonychia lemnae TaxID=5949 RepID=A0A078B5S3_STYLE|nr:UNKNOWN [Stylonychia lemnae]|eukprot:CDW88863.1 UNKNOWN [Stylonychia lemnae]